MRLQKLERGAELPKTRLETSAPPYQISKMVCSILLPKKLYVYFLASSAYRFNQQRLAPVHEVWLFSHLETNLLPSKNTAYLYRNHNWLVVSA